MKNLWKILLICMCSLMAVVTVYMTLQDPNVDYTALQKGYSTTGTKGSFYEFKKDDWIEVLKRIRVLDENGDPLGNYPYVINNVGGSSNGELPGASGVSGHNHIAYRQSKYPDYISSTAWISQQGCGWCSLTSAMAELNPSACGGMAPPAWISVMPSEVREKWQAGAGMYWTAVDAWVNAVNSIGTYGTYEIVESCTSTDTASCLDAIRKYAGEKNCVIVLGTFSGLFTNGGHIILCTDLSDDGQSFHISDSSGLACSKLRSAGIFDGKWEDMYKYDFPLNATGIGGLDYNMRRYSVIRRVK